MRKLLWYTTATIPGKYVLPGTSDEIAVWSRALTAAEVAQLYNNNGVVK